MRTIPPLIIMLISIVASGFLPRLLMYNSVKMSIGKSSQTARMTFTQTRVIACSYSHEVMAYIVMAYMVMANGVMAVAQHKVSIHPN